ncbi:MAG: M50 family metallopeptidase [Clostridiales bacterium]|nr:M50 family metallopeptidase [Clostridiales bacterium]MDY5350482.1 M50 family metallopeptidase [Candidatus Ventricola sp.]MDY5515544.1 M50 family metallopeptidase [Candidatus Ventricola sp.]
MYVVLALVLLGVLIIAHEFGHFLAARLCGIEVVEFSMGMGPLLLKKRSRRGTQFSVRLLPIGGYCQFYGEDEERDDPRAFNRQKIWKRALTVASGPLMNFLIAIVVIALYMSLLGLESIVPRVAEIEEPAMSAGLMVGDEIVTVNGQQVSDTGTIAQAISQSGGKTVELVVLRKGEFVELSIEPFLDEELGRYRVGMTFAVERVRVPLLKSVPFACAYSVESVRAILDALIGILSSGQGADQVTGPVGTVAGISDMTQEGGIDVYLQLLAMVSVNLGVMNLLPIPGLDGSRLLFLLVEAIRRKPVRRELEGAIHAAGLILLMGLMVVLTYKDIVQIFVK